MATKLFKDYTEASGASPDNILLIHDGNGVKKIKKKNFLRDSPGAYLPSVDLGTSYSAELKADISSGKFEKAIVGGFLTINGHVYDFAHPDYWLHCGDTECTTHHMVVVPRSNLVSGKMNSTNITTGGYPGSDFKTASNSNTALADITAIIEADFGAENILTHREYFETAFTNGKPAGGAWADSKIDLMNERMIYGNPVLTVANDGTNIPIIYTTSKSQLELFAKRPDLITNRAAWWLRDPVSASSFARVYADGGAGNSGASNSLGIRPAFAIC